MKLFFIEALKKIALKDKNIIFLTADVGYNALENYRDLLRNRFINAGIAEQNMVTVAAGMASIQLKPWVYSIAPFITLKTTEQIRNDVCHHALNVKFVGNGGGYGYGILGPSHHVLEDISLFLSMPAMKVYVPAFNTDLEPIIKKMNAEKNPSYLRLGLVPEIRLKLPMYSGIRNLQQGKKVTVLVLGSLIHNVLEAIKMVNLSKDIDLWVVTELPMKFPLTLIQSLRKTQSLIILEEHSRIGALADRVAADLLISENIPLKQFYHGFTHGYASHTYGSQHFHLKENNLDPKSIGMLLKRFINTHG